MMTALLFFFLQLVNPGVQPSDLQLVQSQLTASPQFVNSGGFLTQDTLRANFPCGPAPMLGKYAKVSDMYKTVASVAICETDGSTYYWRPTRTDYATTIDQPAGNITLVPFVTSPVVILASSPSTPVTITPSATNAWPGAQFRVYMPATINLPYTVNISGLIGNGTLVAVQGRDYLLTYTSTGWKSN